MGLSAPTNLSREGSGESTTGIVLRNDRLATHIMGLELTVSVAGSRNESGLLDQG